MTIEIEQLSFWYPGGDRAWSLSNVSLRIATGEVVGLVGPSGCGKTTLLRLIGGFLSPSRGALRIDGLDPRQDKARMATVFQTPRLLPWLSAAENVSLPLQLQSNGAPCDNKVRHALSEVGLSDHARAYPDQLSSGMAHRVAIARALVTRPSLLLLDEPFASLDIATRQQMQSLVYELKCELGLTLVLVTHDLAEAMYLCNRILVLASRPPNIREDLQVGTAAGSLPSDVTLISTLREAVRRSTAS